MKTRSAYNPNGVKNFELASTGLFADANLVSYWKFEGNSNDSKGSNNGTDTSITYGNAYGKFGQGADFNGTSSIITFPSTTALPTNGTGNFSIFAWIKTTSTGTRKDFFSGGNTSTTNRGVHLFIKTTNVLEFDLTGTVGPSGTKTLTDGNWHLCGVVNTAGSMQLYVDGVADGSPVAMSPNLNATNCLNAIGHGGGGSGYFNGQVDDTYVFTRALTATEIQTIYSLGTTKAYYPLNGNSTDYSGNGNHGTETTITYPQGKFGQGALFDGTNSQIVYSNTPVSGNVDFTISAWAYFTSSADYSAVIAMGGANTNNSVLIFRNTGATGTIRGNCYGGGGVVDSGVIGELNRWYNIVLIGTASDDILRIYINGIYKSAGSANAWNISGTNANVIGKYATGGENWCMNGLIDEVIIESRAWTAKEVETYYRKSVLNYKTSKSIWNIVYTYISQLSTGTFNLTGNTLTNLWHRIASLGTGAFNLVGGDLIVKRGYGAILATGQFILTGINIIGKFTGWTNQTKSTSTWSNSTKNTSTFTNQTKNTSNWDNQNKN